MATSKQSSLATTRTTPPRPRPRPRRFAPLSPSHTNTHSAPVLKGIIFDVDGTLCLPQNYMFAEMRAALGIPKSVDILAHVQSLSDVPDNPAASLQPTQQTLQSGTTTTTTTTASSSTFSPSPSPRSLAISAIQTIERRAMAQQTPQPGLSELMTYLHARRLRKALCTRNFPAPVQHLLDTYLDGEEGRFWPVITRDTVGVKAKPSPEGIWGIVGAWRLGGGEEGEMGEMGYDEFLEEWARDKEGRENGGGGGGGGMVKGSEGLRKSSASTFPSSTPSPKSTLNVHPSNPSTQTIMVGDSIDDLAAGFHAGAATVLLVNPENAHLRDHEYCNLCVESLGELVGVLEGGFEGRE